MHWLTHFLQQLTLWLILTGLSLGENKPIDPKIGRILNLVVNKNNRTGISSEYFDPIAHVNLVNALLRAVDEGHVFDGAVSEYGAVRYLAVGGRLSADSSKIREHILRLEKVGNGDFPSDLLRSAYGAYAALAPMAELESFLKVRLEESFWSKTYARQAAERTRLAHLPPTPPDEIQPDPLIRLEDPREEVLVAVRLSERRIDPQMVHDWRMLAAKDGLSSLEMRCQFILEQFRRFDQSLRPEIPLPTWAEVVERLGITAAEGELLKQYAEGYQPQPISSIETGIPATTVDGGFSKHSSSQPQFPQQPIASQNAWRFLWWGLGIAAVGGMLWRWMRKLG